MAASTRPKTQAPTLEERIATLEQEVAELRRAVEHLEKVFPLLLRFRDHHNGVKVLDTRALAKLNADIDALRAAA